MKTEYLKFIKWKGEYAYFKKATISDILLASFPLVRLLSKIAKVPEGNIILLKCPKQLREEKVVDIFSSHKVRNTNYEKDKERN